MKDDTRSTIDAEALESILEVTRQLAAPFDLRSMLIQVIEAGRRVLRADRGSVFLYEPETDELVTRIATGVEEIRFPANRGIVGECARKRETINVPDCYADPRFNRDVDRKSGYTTRCLLTLPLIGHDSSLVGVLQLLNKQDGTFDEQDERIAGALAAQCAVALQRVKMTEQLVIKEKLDRELAVAREIQIGILPREMPQVEGYELAGFSRPADETGGDTFDFVPLDEHRLMILLGDATGHGIGPALSVTQVRAMLRIALRLGADLDAAFTHINDQLAQDLADNRFVTAFLGVLDRRTNQVTYHSGGQGPLLHFHAADGKCDWHGASTVPMGFMAGMPLKPARVLDLAPGDILGLITDGVFEYENAAGDDFGEDGVAEVIRAGHEGPARELADALFSSVRSFAGAVPQADDITIVLARRLPE